MDLIGVSPGVLFSYGELVIPLVVLGGALGVPLPSTLVLLAAGALQGGGVLGLLPVAVLALFGAVLGDGGSYLLGRYGGPRVLESLTRGGRAGGVQKARSSFERWGGSTILLTRFLLTPLALPTNLFAGSSGYPFGRFLVFSAAGQAMWVSIFVGLGYLFADSWETLGSVAGNLSWSLLGAVALVAPQATVDKERIAKKAGPGASLLMVKSARGAPYEPAREILPQPRLLGLREAG